MKNFHKVLWSVEAVDWNLSTTSEAGCFQYEVWNWILREAKIIKTFEKFHVSELKTKEKNET